MPHASADANLLFGVLALQMDFITRDQLIAGMQAWVHDKSTPLAEHLVRAGAMGAQRRMLLESLVAEHIHQHGDAQKSLAAIGSAAEIKQNLAGIADAELQRSLLPNPALLPKQAARAPVDATLTFGPSADGSRFRILRPHARGGLGEVFVAHDTELGREVALKEIQLDKSHNADARARFTREAEITGGLEHPGIVPVYGLGTYADGRPYYAMRFIRGQSLLHAIKAYHAEGPSGSRKTATEKNLELRRLLQRFIDVCEAIDYAHSRGVLHRDLKPGNIMLGRYGETLVVDWGLAKPLGETPGSVAAPSQQPATVDDDPSALPEAPLTPASHASTDATQLGSALGTPAYMSPEQAQGRIDLLGPASDVFSLGATLYEILIGKPPYPQTDVFAVQESARNAQYVPPRGVHSDVPKPLDAICRKAMARQIADRYATARQLAADVEKWLADEPVAALAENTWERSTRWLRKNRSFAQAGGLGLMLVTIVSIAAALLINYEQSQKEAAFEAKNKATEEKAAAQSQAALTRSFEMGLNAEKWDAAHVAEMDEVVQELAKLRAAESPALTRRLNERLADRLAARIQVQRLDEQEVAALRRELQSLSRRDEKLAQQLQGELAARETSWHTQFDLAAPFANLPEIFDTDQAQLADGRLRPGNAVGAKERPWMLTKSPVHREASVSVVFDDTWPQAPELGVVLQESGSNNYEFVLRPAESQQADPEELLESDDSPQRLGEARFLSLEIWRNRLPLQRRAFAADQLPPGPLTFRAQRIREELVVQVRDLPELRFFDPFPLALGNGRCGLICPAGLGVERLSAARQLGAQQPSELQTADSLFDAGKHAEAESLYATEVARGQRSAFYEEARYKQALCMLEQNRLQEAEPILQDLLRSEGSRWPMLAGCQLWSAHLRQNDTEAANKVFNYLQSRFDPLQLAMMVPNNLRASIQLASKLEIRPDSRLQFQQGRGPRLEASHAMERLLNPESKALRWAALSIGYAYELDGRPEDLNKALSYYREQLENFPEDFGIMETCRLLRTLGRSDEVLNLIEDRLKHPPSGKARYQFLLEHAKTLEHLGRSTEALAAVERAFEHVDEARSPYLPGEVPANRATLFAIKGLAFESLGDSQAALHAWQAGFAELRPHLKDRTEAHVLSRAVLLGPLSQQMTEAEAKLIISEVVRYSAAGITSKAVDLLQPELGNMAGAFRQMTEGKLAKNIVRKLALSTHFRGDRAKLHAVMAGLSYGRLAVFGGQSDEAREEVLAKVFGQLYVEAGEERRIGVAELAALGAAWKGFGGVDFFAAGLKKLSPDLQAGMLYIFAHRIQQTGGKPDAVRTALIKAADVADISDDLRKLIENDLQGLPPAEP